MQSYQGLGGPIHNLTRDTCVRGEAQRCQFLDFGCSLVVNAIRFLEIDERTIFQDLIVSMWF